MLSKSYDLPLFLELEDPIGIYVIDNHLIAFIEYGSIGVHPGKAFRCLHTLYSNDTIRSFLPERFLTHFPSDFRLEDYSVPFPGIVGQLGEGTSHTLILDLEITDNQTLPISLHNFRYVNIRAPGHNEITNFDFKVRLSPVDAFLIFANICANGSCLRLQRLANQRPIQCSLLEQLKVVNTEKHLSEEINDLIHRITNFSIDYLQFLCEQFSSKNISPFEMLRLSGARSLAFLYQEPILQQFYSDIRSELLNNYQNLSTNQKIAYYAFLRIATSNSHELYELNLPLFTKLQAELHTEMPEFTGEYSDKIL